MIDIATGFTGFTIDVFDGSTSDREGDVQKVLFAFTYQLRVNDVNFTITNGADHWSAMMPSGEYISLSNPKVVFSNRDSAIVQFDMAEKYPSNTLAILAYRNIEAKFTIAETDEERPFIPNTIIGSMGFSSNEYGGGTNDEGEVERIVFNISFANHRNEVEFTISEDPADWSVLMGDGAYINLINPHVLFQNRDGATIVFQMVSPYPSNSPGFLVRKRKEAGYTITEIDEDHPFVPIQNIVFPTYIPAGERLNLHSQVVVYPMNSTIRGIEWSLATEGVTGAVIQNGWITTARPGRITLKAHIPNGLGLGSDYSQNIEVMVIDNWIVIDQQPHMQMAAITGSITEEISVIATTPSGELTYQWYKNTSSSNEGGTAISGASSSIYKLLKGLIPGDYYYFCEVRKLNFPSVRTDVVKIRVRDKLIKLDIFPPAASIPPGNNQQFAVTRNPQTSDELGKVVWHSNNHSVITIDKNGLATAFNPGVAIISANIGDIVASITATTVYTPVNSVNFTMDRVLETGTIYDLPKTVMPTNASKQEIIWSIISAGTTGSMINAGKITPNNVGTMTLRATIVNGLNPTTNFVQEFTINVIKGIVPVADITLTSIGTPRVGDIIALQGTCIPSNASNNNISWTIQDAASTRAKIQSGNLLTVENPGRIVILATVVNGKGKNSNFTKIFNIEFLASFVAVSGIEGFPSELDYFSGLLGVELLAYAAPDNADNKNIIYKIADTNVSSIYPKIVDNLLTYDSTSMTFESEESITISMTIKNGLSNGVDYVSESTIYITNPAAPTVFVPVIDAVWELPTSLRAYRPILIDRAIITPWDCTNKALNWDISREKDIGGCASLVFIPTDENHADLIANGVLFDDTDFSWTENTNYIYPMSKGELKVTLTIQEGLGVNQPFSESQTLTFKDPFIPVKDIKNVPSQIFNGSAFHLSPEIDTGDGMNEQTAEWDDRVSTYNKIEYEITNGMNLATINSSGIITAKSTGNIVVKMTIRSGLQEEYTWHAPTGETEKKKFPRIDFVKSFNIKIVAKEKDNNIILRVKKTGGIFGSENIDIYTESDYNMLRSIGPAEGNITLRGKTLSRNSITEIEFYDKFSFTDLSNFGRNFTSLTKINKIPDTATNLRNFLMGCKSFNQSISIPSKVNGSRCLEGFLRDCINYNQYIRIPSNINGDKCLESFLRGCTKFNRAVTAPASLTGDCCMYSFLHDCISLNSTVILPKKIHGKRCMENVLRNCQSFNKNITLPEEISGNYNLAAFMYTCNNMQSAIIVPTEEFVEGSMTDVITLSTFYRNSNISQQGVTMKGPGAVAFQTKTGDQGSETLVPIRTLKADTGVVPEPEPIPRVVDVKVLKEVVYSEGHTSFLVGDNVAYTITVTNNSNTDVTGLNIIDVIPEEILYDSTECTNESVIVELIREEVIPEEPATEEPTLGKVKEVKLKLASMAIDTNVIIKIITSATTVADGITNTATLTFDQASEQESTEGNVSSAMINIVTKHPDIIPED